MFRGLKSYLGNVIENVILYYIILCKMVIIKINNNKFRKWYVLVRRGIFIRKWYRL